MGKVVHARALDVCIGFPFPQFRLDHFVFQLQQRYNSRKSVYLYNYLVLDGKLEKKNI